MVSTTPATNILIRVALCGLILAIAGCGPAAHHETQSENPAEMPPSSEPSKHKSLIDDGFSWVIPGTLAAMPLPGRTRPLDHDAAFLEEQGIGLLISLTGEPPPANVLAARGMRQLHLPVEDFTPPTQDQMLEFVEAVSQASGEGVPVGVHCTAGLGRSGTMAAAFLVAEGSSPEEAISTIRELRPGSIETPAQEEAVREFATLCLLSPIQGSGSFRP